MTCGRTLFFGPIIALSLVVGVARSANECTQGAATSTEENVDQVALQRAVQISDDATAIWRRSRTDTATGSRFIKPSIPRPTNAPAPARALVTDDGPAHLHAKFSRTGVRKGQTATTDRQLAGATAAKLQQLIEQPKSQTPAAVQPPNHPACGEGAVAVCATDSMTQSEYLSQIVITDENEFSTEPGNDQTASNSPNDSADQQVSQDAGSAPRQLWAAGSRLLHGIGQLFP